MDPALKSLLHMSRSTKTITPIKPDVPLEIITKKTDQSPEQIAYEALKQQCMQQKEHTLTTLSRHIEILKSPTVKDKHFQKTYPQQMIIPMFTANWNKLRNLHKEKEAARKLISRGKKQVTFAQKQVALPIIKISECEVTNLHDIETELAKFTQD